MARNNYFKVSSRESNLFDQLVREQIKIYGFDVHYIFRKFQNLDALFGEDPTSKFDKSFQIEMFVSNYEFFESLGRVIDKFGINLQDSVTLMVSKNRFSEESIKYGTDLLPQEGDLIYFPEYGGLFEIKFVNARNSFFAYELSCDRFRYSAEQIDTEIAEVDQIEENLITPINSYTLATTGVTFYEGEKIYQGASLGSSTYSGVVVNFDSVTNTVKVRSEVGTASSILPLRGDSSNTVVFYDNKDETEENYIESNNDDTNVIELERAEKDLIDFSDKDPFSEGNY
jgi:Virus neck protein